MNQLLSARINVFYRKEKKDFERINELVLLIDEPSYDYSNEGEIIRQRGIKEIRFAVMDKNKEELLEMFKNLLDCKPEDLK